MEPLNRKELADLLGVTVRTVSNHQMEMGFRDGKYDPRTAVRYWVNYVQEQKDKEHGKSYFQVEQEKEKLWKLKREREIIEGAYISKEDTRDTILKLVHITKTKFLSVKNILQRKLKLSPAQAKIVNAELVKALEELSKGVNQNGREKPKPRPKQNRGAVKRSPAKSAKKGSSKGIRKSS